MNEPQQDRQGRPLPVVTRSTTIREAVAILADPRVRWLIVAEPDGIPRFAIGGNDLLRAMLPEYILEDPTLARVYDRDSAREVLSTTLKRTIGDVLDRIAGQYIELPHVSPIANEIDLAATFLQTGSTVAYIEGTAPKDPRFATLPGLFERLTQVIAE